MSKQGQILRGEKWYNLYRDGEGKLLPVIANDKSKMVEVNIFLETVKKEEEAKVKPKSKEKK